MNPGRYEQSTFKSIKKGSRTIFPCISHQMSIIVIPGLIQLLTYVRTCRCASAACLKSLHISSLALSSTRFSSQVILHAALRLAGSRQAQHSEGTVFSHDINIRNEDGAGLSSVANFQLRQNLRTTDFFAHLEQIKHLTLQLIILSM